MIWRREISNGESNKGQTKTWKISRRNQIAEIPAGLRVRFIKLCPSRSTLLVFVCMRGLLGESQRVREVKTISPIRSGQRKKKGWIHLLIIIQTHASSVVIQVRVRERGCSWKGWMGWKGLKAKGRKAPLINFKSRRCDSDKTISA